MSVKYFKVWSTAADDNVCLECAKMEGSAVPVSEKFRMNGFPVPDPPLHCNCRCCLIYDVEENLKPQLLRDYQSFLMFSSLANDSSVFHGAVMGYHASMFFLKRLALASDSELHSAGLHLPKGYNLKDEIIKLQNNEVLILSQALMRAYNAVASEAETLKTERGKRSRILRFCNEALEQSDYLPPSIISAIRNIV